MDNQANEKFNVFQFFADGSQEKVMENVEVFEAIDCVQGLISSIGAQLGTTQRIIITDTLDCCNLDWVYGKGIVFPKLEDIIND